MKKAPTSQNVKLAGIVPTVRLAVNESGIYKAHDIVKGDIEFEGAVISVVIAIQKKDGYPTYNFGGSVTPRYANPPMHPWR